MAGLEEYALNGIVNNLKFCSGPTIAESAQAWAQRLDTQQMFLKQPGAQQLAKELDDDVAKRVVGRIGEYMSRHLADNILSGIIEEGWSEIELGEKITFEDSSKGPRGGAYGTFIEENIMGLAQTRENQNYNRSDPRADILDLETEMKAILGKSAITVGKITVEGMASKDVAGGQFVRQRVLMEKMMMKMNNLIIFSVEENLESPRARMRINAITLFTTLIYSIAQTYIMQGGTITLEKSGQFNAERGSQEYEVKLNQGTKLEHLLELYLHRYDIYSNIKADEKVRKAFWAAIRENNLSEIVSQVTKTALQNRFVRFNR